MELNKAIREEAKLLVQKSENSIKKWQALFQHWEDDRTQALQHPIDLRAVTDAPSSKENLNTFTFGASTIGPLSFVASSLDSSVLDYSSTGTVQTFGTKIAFGSLWGAGLLAGPTAEGFFEHTSTTSIIDQTTEEKSTSKTVSTTFVEPDAGNTLCVQLFKSPCSGTFVYKVCGGATMCPHILGTDARHKLKLKTLEIPSAALEVDGGRIVFELDTLDMLDDDIEDIDVVFELDGATALFPVSFDIGSALC